MFSLLTYNQNVYMYFVSARLYNAQGKKYLNNEKSDYKRRSLF